jgi:hypothetical protein
MARDTANVSVHVMVANPQVKRGDFIRLREAFDPDDRSIDIPQYDVVQIIEDPKKTKGWYKVRTIMNEVVTLPPGFPFDKVKSGKVNVLFEFSAQASPIDLQVLAAPIDPEKERKAANRESNKKIIFMRCINKMQAVASNALVSDDPSTLAKLSVAASCISMAANADMTTNQSSRLLTLATKLTGTS